MVRKTTHDPLNARLPWLYEKIVKAAMSGGNPALVRITNKDLKAIQKELTPYGIKLPRRRPGHQKFVPQSVVLPEKARQGVGYSVTPTRVTVKTL